MYAVAPVSLGAHDGRRPAVLRREPLPRFDGVRPRFGITDGITTGEADADLDAVRDRGLAARREDDRLVAAGGEVSERVVGTEVLDQPADRGLVISGEGVVGALRAEERHDGGEERDGTEETEDRVDEDTRVAVEHLVVDRSRRGDAVQGPEESLVLRQVTWEEFDKAPTDHGRDSHAADQHAECFPAGAAPYASVELGPRRDENSDHDKQNDNGHGVVRVLVDDRGGDVGEGDQ